jgi:hypothetical protein
MAIPEVCPNCGADVPPRAKACPECGSCEETGWSENATHDGLDLPDEEFNYSKFVEQEFGAKKPKTSGVPWYLWLAALFILGVILLLLLAR